VSGLFFSRGGAGQGLADFLVRGFRVKSQGAGEGFCHLRCSKKKGSEKGAKDEKSVAGEYGTNADRRGERHHRQCIGKKT